MPLDVIDDRSTSEKKAEKKIAIVGKAPSSLGLAPFDDESCEIWTLSDLVSAGQVPRFTRHFEIHPLDWFPNRGDGYWEWLCKPHEQPIYVRQTDPDVPAGVLYPLDEITGHFGRYFTNTVSWMIALAIHEKATKIHVYGVDMAQDTEYASQRPSCEFFMGWAAGAGIEIYVPPQADMLKTLRLYGFEHEATGEVMQKFQARTAELTQRFEKKSARCEELRLEAAFLQGAIESQRYFKQWIAD